MGQRRIAVTLVWVRMGMGMRVGVGVALGTVSGHPLRGVVDAGDGAAGQRVGAETARGVRRVPLGVGQLLVVGLHGRWHHVEHDDRGAHGLTEHVLGSGTERAGSSLKERFGVEHLTACIHTCLHAVSY